MYPFKTARLTLVRTRENNPTLTSIYLFAGVGDCYRFSLSTVKVCRRLPRTRDLYLAICRSLIHVQDAGSLKFKYLLLRGRDAKTVSPKSIACVMHEMAWFLAVIRARGRSEIYLHCSTTTFNYFSFSLTNNLVSIVLTYLPARLFVQGAASSQGGKSRTLQKLKWKSSSKNK